MASIKKRRIKKKKILRNVPRGIVHIQASFNNTIITITDPEGNALCWSSCGACGFKGSKKSTPFAAQVASQNAARKAKDFGMRYVEVYVSGPGAGRESAIRAVQSVGLNVTMIKDTTPLPHNGCRPKKRRRV